MRVSHSWSPKLNILEILTHFWPSSEPCRQATIKDMDFIFPVRTPPSLTRPPCKYEGMGMYSWSTVVCQSWGQFQWNLVLYGSKCPILKWVHQTGQIYKRPRDTGLISFRVDSNLIGRSSVTRFDRMRVSHSWTPKLNILEILKHFWPASEPCRQATINDMDIMFPVPALPSLT